MSQKKMLMYFCFLIFALTGQNYASDSVEVYSRDEAYTGGTINESKPRLYVTNMGTEDITDITVYYHFTVEDSKTPVLEDYYTPGVTPYLEDVGDGNWRIRFDFRSIVITPGQSSPDLSGLSVGLHYSDYSAWDYENDYSNPASSSFSQNTNIELFLDDDRVWGNPPGYTDVYTVSVTIIGAGQVTKDPDKEEYSDGEILTLTATPQDGYIFKEWSGDISDTVNPISIGVNGNKTITATFMIDEIVARKITATEVVVTPKWQIPPPDYVFDHGYELQTINEVSEFIGKNKHLKGIPSAKELKKNGINITEMNMKLLEKIEELTLYIIYLNSEIEKQKKIINDIK